jgi:PTS system nitrogen regulatory IIA component
MHFGAALRVLRTDAGVSLRRLAEQIGVSSAYLSRVEHGRDHAPTADRLTEIARVLGLPPLLLLELADRVQPFVGSYLERVPAAGALFVDIARRGLTPTQIARVKTWIEREFPDAGTAEPPSCRLSSLLSPERVVLQLSCHHLEDAVAVAASVLTPGRNADSATIATAIMQREHEGTTALGDGVAAPHAVVRGVKPQAVLVTFAEPLVYETPDGLPLRALIVLLLDDPGATQLELLAQATKLATPATVAALCAAKSAPDLIKIIRAQLP